jgi:hypothetical protein
LVRYGAMVMQKTLKLTGIQVSFRNILALANVESSHRNCSFDVHAVHHKKNTHRWSHRHVQIWAVPVSSPQTSSTAWSRIVSCSAPPCETLGKEWDAAMICATFLVYYQRINERV